MLLIYYLSRCLFWSLRTKETARKSTRTDLDEDALEERMEGAEAAEALGETTECAGCHCQVSFLDYTP